MVTTFTILAMIFFVLPWVFWTFLKIYKKSKGYQPWFKVATIINFTIPFIVCFIFTTLAIVFAL